MPSDLCPTLKVWVRCMSHALARVMGRHTVRFVTPTSEV